MMAILEKLVEALRDELQQYGEMLALLDRQQEFIRLRGADDVVDTLSNINSQSLTILKSRQTRQTLQQQLAWSLGQPENRTFAHLLPLVPEHYRLLVSALVHENNELLQRVSDRAQENQTLLHRSVEQMQRFITSLSPTEPPVSEGGNTSLVSEPGTTFYEAIQ